MSDEPIAGYYMTKLVRNGPFVPVHLYWGQPVLDDEVQDRSPRWCVIVDGRTDFIEGGDNGYQCRAPLDPMRYWPWCGRHPISQADYLYMIDKAQWAKTYAPDRPEAQPRTKIDRRGASIF